MSQTWTCDGEPKNNQNYPNCSGPHPEHENYGDVCVICGLPKEAMSPGKTVVPTQMVNPGKTTKINWLIPGAIAAIVLIIGGIGWFLLRPKPPSLEPVTTGNGGNVQTPTGNGGGVQPTGNTSTANLISQGNRILLADNPEKSAGATAFAQQNWSEAIAAYQQAVDSNPNDPESQIYLNNAKARQQGTPITIAAVVPIASSTDSAQEILRGIAQYQSEFNQNQGGRLLEVIVVDQNPADRSIASPLAQALIDNPDVLAVIGYGADLSSKLAMQTYESSQLAVLSPVNTKIEGTNLRLISLNQAEDKLVEDYLNSVAQTLLEYAQTQKTTPKVVIFYNSSSDYSNNLKDSLIATLPQVNGELVEAIDIDDPGFNPSQAINQASQNQANTVILALSKDRITEAIDIADNNQNQMLLLGGDEMYNPQILVQGQDKVSNLVLAVPWSSTPGDTFAQEALQLWKGKVSWRTKTAYDATKILTESVSQNPNRGDIYQSLQQGITIQDSGIDLNIFGEVPLVKATPGNHGPAGSTHGFTAI